MVKKKKGGSFASIFTYTIVVLLLVGVVGLLSVFTDSFTTNLRTFYVEYNGKALVKNNDSLTLECNKDLKFNLHFLDENQDYNVEIIPCGSFGYTFDGNDSARYENIIETIPTDLYSVSKTDDGFVLRLEEFSIMTVLKKYHGADSNIVLPEGFNLFGSYYALVISFAGQEESYKIVFDLKSPVESIELGGDIVL